MDKYDFDGITKELQDTCISPVLKPPESPENSLSASMFNIFNENGSCTSDISPCSSLSAHSDTKSTGAENTLWNSNGCFREDKKWDYPPSQYLEANEFRQKSLSVPQLNLKIPGYTQRKKTSEAGAINDDMEQLQKKLNTLEGEKNQLLKVNYYWNGHCEALQAKMDKVISDSCQLKKTFNTELNGMRKEIQCKDEKIERLKTRLEETITNMTETSSQEEIQRQKDLRVTDEEHLHSVEKKCSQLAQLLNQNDQEKRFLAAELNRLKYEASENTESLPPSQVVSLLQQQLQVYAEDFKAEKSEKEKLHQDIVSLKRHVTELSEEKDLLLKQLQYYEEDFHREREKRIELLRKTGYSRPTPSCEHVHHKPIDYCCAAAERERLQELDNHNSCSSRFNRQHYTLSPTISNPLPRTRPPPDRSFDRNSGEYFRNYADPERSYWTSDAYTRNATESIQ